MLIFQVFINPKSFLNQCDLHLYVKYSLINHKFPLHWSNTYIYIHICDIYVYIYTYNRRSLLQLTEIKELSISVWIYCLCYTLAGTGLMPPARLRSVWWADQVTLRCYYMQHRIKPHNSHIDHNYSDIYNFLKNPYFVPSLILIHSVNQHFCYIPKNVC
jgi:hypothetical protein